MLASGNGEVQRCVLNLLRTVRGEVPYVRTKGIDRALIDIPSTEAWRFRADAEWVIRNFEPRAELSDVELDAAVDAARSGDVTVVAQI